MSTIFSSNKKYREKNIVVTTKSVFEKTEEIKPKILLVIFGIYLVRSVVSKIFSGYGKICWNINGRLRARFDVFVMIGGIIMDIIEIIEMKKRTNKRYIRATARPRGNFFRTKYTTPGLRALMIIKAMRSEKSRSRINQRKYNPSGIRVKSAMECGVIVIVMCLFCFMLFLLYV